MLKKIAKKKKNFFLCQATPTAWATHKNSVKIWIPCTEVHGFEEKSKFHVQVHGFEEKTKYHVPRYMDLKKKQNSMYPGTWIWEKKNLGTSWKKLQGGAGAGAGGIEQILFWNLIYFFDIQFKNTFNLIFLGFKVPSKRFFLQEFQIRSYFFN